MEEIRAPKTSKKLISMLGEEDWSQMEDENLEEIKSLMVADSYDGTFADEEDNCISNRRGKRASSDDGADNRRRRRSKKEEDDRVNPDHYPELGKYLKQELMEDEAQRNWTVIGNQNARLLQQEWQILMDKQIGVSVAKMDLFDEIYSFIMDIIESNEES